MQIGRQETLENSVQKINTNQFLLSVNIPVISPFLQQWIVLFLKAYIERLPRWYSGWESAHQGRGHGFDPCPGKIPQARGATKSMYHNY